MKLFRSAAATTIEPPEPRQVTHHHHPVSIAGPAIVVAVLIVALLWGAERWLVSLLARLEVQDPEAVFALIFWSVLVGLPGLWLTNKVLHGWAEVRHRHRLDLEDKRLARLELQHRLQSSVVAETRTADPNEARRISLITQVMTDAYDHLSKHEQYTGRHKRPWARRNAGQYILTGEQDPVGEGSTVVVEAIAWLRDNQVLTGPPKKEQVNTAEYPNLAAVQRKLHKPVVVGNWGKNG